MRKQEQNRLAELAAEKVNNELIQTQIDIVSNICPFVLDYALLRICSVQIYIKCIWRIKCNGVINCGNTYRNCIFALMDISLF